MSNLIQQAICLIPFRLLFGLILFLTHIPVHAIKIAEGAFQSKESGIQALGSFEVQSEAGKFSLVVRSDFKISEGPDLFFVFSPMASTLITGKNAKNLALKVEPGLKSLTGAQTYGLPDNFDISKYPTLIVHCWKYDHLYATAVITQGSITGIRSKPQLSRSLSGFENRAGLSFNLNGRWFSSENSSKNGILGHK